MHTDLHHTSAEWCVLVEDLGIEQPSRFVASLSVNVPVLWPRPSARKRWPSEDEGLPSPQFTAKARLN